jgi:hypothetical protein
MIGDDLAEVIADGRENGQTLAGKAENPEQST